MFQGMKPFWLCSRCAGRYPGGQSPRIARPRSFATSTALRDVQPQDPAQPTNDHNAASAVLADRAPIGGSRRRRAALEGSDNIPFEQLPYQCFQEALKVLREDRAQKVLQIEDQRGRIARLVEKLREAQDGGSSKSALDKLERSLGSSSRHLEWLKVQADINDPLVKKRFEDGLGDLGKPVYRHLAQRKWEGYERKIVMQRIAQMHVVPDVLPKVDPTVQVRLSFNKKRVAHGVVVPSNMSEEPPTIHAQTFEGGEKLVSIVVLDSDIPNVETDGFDKRLHALLANVKITPTSGVVSFKSPPSDADLVTPWLPPTAQKGAPWHRLSVWVLEQPDGQPLDAVSIRERYTRETFGLRSFIDKYLLNAIGVTMFRTKWDEETRAVMERHGIEGGDVEYTKKAITPMKYKKKDGARYR